MPYRSPSRDLGPLERRYRTTKNVRPIVVIGGVFGLPGALLIAGFHSAPGQVFAGDRSTNIALGLVLVGMAVAGVVAVIRKATLSIDVHTNGFVWKEGGVPRSIGWSEVAGIRGTHTSRTTAGVEVARSRVYQVVLEGGRVLVATHMLGDVADFAERLERAVETRLYPGIKSRMDDNQTVSFGPVELTSRGIETGSELLSWESLEGVEVASGVIAFRAKDRKPIEVEWARVLNPKLLVTVVGGRLT